MLPRNTTVLALALFTALFPAACKRDGAGEGGPPASSAKVAATSPTVTIPAGTFRAGDVCGALPRITNEELGGTEIALGEYSIDVFPYPNDPTQVARTGVTRDEAANLCAQSGKRLCTELEWERACKGPGVTPYEYGPAYNPMSCKKESDLSLDKRPKCVSGFGVKDMHGLVFEWTSSAWGRGSGGDLATVRGGDGPAGILQARCANGQGRAAATPSGDVGFRCCSGPKNTQEVSIDLTVLPAIVPEPSLDAALDAAIMTKLPPDHRTTPDADVGIDAIWRWHPRPNEELLVARWTTTPRDKTRSIGHELAVFHVCGVVPSLITRMRGPVATLAAPIAGTDPQKLTVAVATDPDKGEVKIEYIHGAAKFDQPPWVKFANALPAPASSAHVQVVLPKPKR